MKNIFINKNFNLGNVNLFSKWIINPLLRNKNSKKINLKKISKKIFKLINKKKINFIIVDNIRVGLVAIINKKNFIILIHLHIYIHI